MYADFVFLIKYKQIILGVIDVKVTQKNWGRFIGIGYLHLFKTLADMLALFFYRVRLAEEHSRVVKAVKWLGDAVYMSHESVIKSLGVLELVSKKKNAFDELLIDRGFLETWVSQISMALKYAYAGDQKEFIEKRKPTFNINKVNKKNVISLLDEINIERKYGIVGSGRAISVLREQVFRASKMMMGPILIEGDNGTGKELVARAIHRLGEKPFEKFFPVDCGAFSRELVEDTLFGHVKGFVIFPKY